MTRRWGAVRGTITVDERFGEACLQGLEGFSHAEVLPHVGVFAGRGPRRPNRIGVTCCAIESVDGRELTVVGLDAVSGTPVVDLKPVMTEFLPRNVTRPEWVSRMMSDFFKP